MSRLLFDAAGAVVLDPAVANRNATRSSLFQLGFQNVELMPTAAALVKFLADNSPDLLIAEMTGDEAGILELVQSVREGKTGNNPFLVVVLTTWQRDGAIVTKAINSGADDLVARPISTRMLGERIKLQIERRKGFVVTHGYIGPDRRRDSNRPGAQCIEVPNTLRIRTFEGLPPPEANMRIRTELEKGKDTLAVAKLKSDVVQLCVQWRLLERLTPGTREFFVRSWQVGRAAAKVQERSVNNEKENASELCAAVVQAGETLNGLEAMTKGTPDFESPLKKLAYAALRLGQIYAPGIADREDLAASLTLDQGLEGAEGKAA